VPLPVSAQNGFLEEVVVIARKREESLQETPVAVTALGEDALREANIRDLRDLTRVVPGLSTRDGDKFAAFSIRGVGSRGGKSVATDPAVGVYVDGIFIPRSDSQLVDVVAMENVQVLRGPQGTLFGKNTAGGALLLTTVKPGDDFAGEVAVDYGNLERGNISGALDVPVTDSFALRLTADYRSRDGYMEDVVTGIDFGNEDKLAFALQGRWSATDTLNADFLLFHSKQDENSSPQTCQVADGPVTPLQTFTAPGDSRRLLEACEDSDQLHKRDKVEMDTDGMVWEMESTMAGMTLDWEVGGGNFRSITGWLRQEDIRNWRDQDAVSVFSINNLSLVLDQFEANNIENGEEREFLSQEFQFTSSAFDGDLDYTVGLFASRENIDNNPFGNMLSPAGFLGIPVGDSVLVLPPAVAGFRLSSVADYDNSTWAAFAQGTWHINEQWNLTLGARYGQESKEVEQRNYITAESSPGQLSRAEFDALVGTVHEVVPAAGIEVLDADEDWSEFTPAATLAYMGSDDLLDSTGLDAFMVYFTWSQGFKAGGFSVIEDEAVPFDPEEVTNYELGVKLDALESRLRFNAALYSMDYTDMQITVTRQINEINTAAGIANAGESTMNGLEIELSYLPTENWFFQLSADFIDAEYDEFMDIYRNPDTGEFEDFDRSHENFAYLPDQTISVVAQYTQETRWGEISARLSGYYRDEIYIGLEAGADESGLSYLDDVTLWNARLAWRPSGDLDVEVAFYMDNIADEDYFGSGNLQLSAQGTRSVVKGMPRTYGLQARYWF
jgi:outer membrane receptor protein involved in Fe transport